MENREYNRGDSLGLAAIVLTVVLAALVPSFFLKVLLIAAGCVGCFVLASKSHWTRPWNPFLKYGLAATIVVLLVYVAAPQLRTQWRSDRTPPISTPPTPAPLTQSDITQPRQKLNLERPSDGDAKASPHVRHSPAVLKLTFQDSPALTAARTERISRVLNDYYAYLTSDIGLELPKELPPIGVTPKGGLIMAGGVSGAPSYYSHIMLPVDSLEKDDIVRTAYSFYAIGDFLWVNPPTSANQAGYSEAKWLFPCYFASSFSGKVLCIADIPADKWLKTMWDVRQKYGKFYADKVMGFTLRMWHTSPPGEWKTFDQLFMNKLRSGEIVMNGNSERFNEVQAIAVRHGIQLQ